MVECIESAAKEICASPQFMSDIEKENDGQLVILAWGKGWTQRTWNSLHDYLQLRRMIPTDTICLMLYHFNDSAIFFSQRGMYRRYKFEPERQPRPSYPFV